MQRYGETEEYFCVKKSNLLRSTKVNGKFTKPLPTNGIPSCSIMGSWVEVE